MDDHGNENGIEYPSNSLIAPPPADKLPDRRTEKIAEGKRVVTRKKTFLERALGEKLRYAGAYVVASVMIPALKDLLVDIVKDGIDAVVFGDRQPASKSRNQGFGQVAYHKMSRDDRNYRDRDRERTINRATGSFDDIVFARRNDADNILDSLINLVDEYGAARVSDFYDMAGIEGQDWNDRDYGWENLSRAEIRHTREGYVVYLPKPIRLK